MAAAAEEEEAAAAAEVEVDNLLHTIYWRIIHPGGRHSLSVHTPPPGGRHGSGPAVLASAYVSEAGRVAVALANWAPHAVTVRHTHYGAHTYLLVVEPVLLPWALVPTKGVGLGYTRTAILTTRCG